MSVSINHKVTYGD